jgi:chromosome segregation ATPase
MTAPARLEEEEELSSRPATETGGEAASGGADAGMERVVRRLEREAAAAAKQTEMKMLESLVRQTKELEQAKIALEEARLEVAALRQQKQQQEEAGPAPPAQQQQQQQWSVMDLMFGGVDEEINGLRARLRAASQAEERSRKAADDLTAALSAVTMEARQVKAWLSDAQAELEAANAEVDRLRGLLHGAEAELWSATEQVGTLTSE